MAEKLVAAIVLKEFSSTVIAGLSAGKIIQISQHRFNVWKAQGLVDHPPKAKAAAPAKAPKTTSKKKGKWKK